MIKWKNKKERLTKTELEKGREWAIQREIDRAGENESEKESEKERERDKAREKERTVS